MISSAAREEFLRGIIRLVARRLRLDLPKRTDPLPTADVTLEVRERLRGSSEILSIYLDPFANPNRIVVEFVDGDRFEFHDLYGDDIYSSAPYPHSETENEA